MAESIATVQLLLTPEELEVLQKAINLNGKELASRKFDDEQLEILTDILEEVSSYESLWRG